MKKIIAASAMALALTTSASAGVTVGLGYAAGSGSDAGVRVPIDFDFGLRLEPELGLSTGSGTTGVLVGFGGYYNIVEVEKVNIFVGGRFGYSKTSYDVGPVTYDANTLNISALVGAEYFVVENKMSVAVQVGLGNTSYSGDLDADGTSGTTGAVVGRFFF